MPSDLDFLAKNLISELTSVIKIQSSRIQELIDMTSDMAVVESSATQGVVVKCFLVYALKKSKIKSHATKRTKLEIMTGEADEIIN